jgi:hypothetical protein
MELAWHSDPDLTLNTYAHTRMEDLARVVDSLPTSKLWASDPLCDSAHTMPPSGVSEALNGTARNPPEMRPEASRQAPDNPPYKLPGLDSLYPKSSQDQEETTHQETLSHALPTFSGEDPDLALIVGLWDRLADQIKARLIEIVKANMPSEG